MTFFVCFSKEDTKLEKVKFLGIFAVTSIQWRLSRSEHLRQLTHLAVLVSAASSNLV